MVNIIKWQMKFNPAA